MKKPEAEKAIRHLCDVWRKASGNADTPTTELHFSEFWSWLEDNHRPYTLFRSTMGARYDAEIWFDEEFGLMWQR